MNENEKCLLNFLSNCSQSACDGVGELFKFLFDHNLKIEFNNFNPIYNIIDEMEYSKELGYNFAYEQEKLD